MAARAATARVRPGMQTRARKLARPEAATTERPARPRTTPHRARAVARARAARPRGRAGSVGWRWPWSSAQPPPAYPGDDDEAASAPREDTVFGNHRRVTTLGLRPNRTGSARPAGRGAVLRQALRSRRRRGREAPCTQERRRHAVVHGDVDRAEPGAHG